MELTPVTAAPLARIRGFLADRLIRWSLVVLTFSILGAAADYVFYGIAGRALGPAGFGVLAAVLAFIALVGRPLNAIQNNTAHHVAFWRGRAPGSQARTLRKVGWTSIVIAGALSMAIGALAPVLGPLLHVSSSLVLASAVIVWCTGPSLFFAGILYGEQRFVAVGLADVVPALLRIAVSAAFFFVGWGVLGGVVGTLARVASGAVMMAVATRKELTPSSEQEHGSVREFVAYSGPVLLALVTTGVWTSTDVLVVKAFFSDAQAGLYAGAAVFGKAEFLLATALASVLFPMVSEGVGAGTDARPTLRRALIVASAVGVAFTAAVVVGSTVFVRLALGPSFASAASLLPVFGVAIAFVSLDQVLLGYALASRDRVAVWICAIGALMSVALMVAFHPTVLLVIVDMGASAAILALVVGARLLSAPPRNPSASR